MSTIRIGSDVRLSFASGKLGTVEDIVIDYTVNKDPIVIVWVREISGKLTAKLANQVAPLHGTITASQSNA